MRYFEGISTDSSFNLAMEQYVFDSMPRSESYFLLWQNAPSVIIGKYQNAYEEVSQTYVTEHGIPVIRRLSGGGAVYHDLGNINYTFITDGTLGEELSFAAFCEPLIRTLGQLGIRAETGGRNDVTIDGMKISGTAQYCRKGRIMHHGTILFDSDLSVMPRVLTPPAAKVTSKGVKSVKSRVTNIADHLSAPMAAETFRDVFRGEVFRGEALRGREAERGTFSDEDLRAIGEIRGGRYGTWEWNWGKSPEAAIVKERYIEGVGRVTAHLGVSEGRISEISFSGDFFGDGPSEELLGRLAGCAFEKTALTDALSGIRVGACFFGLSADELVRLLLS